MNETTDKKSVATINVACNESQPLDGTQEEWRPVVGYEGLYEVSSLGRVRDAITFMLIPRASYKNRGKESIYPAVRLFRRNDKGLRVSTVIAVHNLVAAAFLVNATGGYRLRHKDGNPENNAASNLEWPESKVPVPHNIDGETWLPIPGFPGYEVSDYGQVRNSRTGKLLKQHFGSSPYLEVCLYRQEGGKAVPCSCLVHRLVAFAFLPLIEGKNYVDHINTIKTDNRVCNLKWCTTVENQNNPLTYARQVEVKRERAKSQIWRDKVSKAHNCRKKLIRCIETGLVYPSIHEAERVLHRARAAIKRSCEDSKNNAIQLFPSGSYYRGKLVLHFEYYTYKSIDELIGD